MNKVKSVFFISAVLKREEAIHVKVDKVSQMTLLSKTKNKSL